MTSLHFTAVLFDVDGTLLDSNAAHERAWTQALAEHGVTVPGDQVRRMIGMGGDKLLPALARVSEDSSRGQAISRRKKRIFSTLLPALQPTPGARALLEYLRDAGAELVIATSADQSELEGLLKRAGVDDLIPTHASKDDGAQSKPDPDIVHAALAKVSARPEQTVMIGDTPYDIEAAARAGIRAIALRCGGFWTDGALSSALAIFDDPAGLLARWRATARPLRDSDTTPG